MGKSHSSKGHSCNIQDAYQERQWHSICKQDCGTVPLILAHWAWEDTSCSPERGCTHRIVQRNIGERSDTKVRVLLLRDAESTIDRFIEFYNKERLHSAIDYRTPKEVYEAWKENRIEREAWIISQSCPELGVQSIVFVPYVDSKPDRHIIEFR